MHVQQIVLTYFNVRPPGREVNGHFRRPPFPRRGLPAAAYWPRTIFRRRSSRVAMSRSAPLAVGW
jgi:hypothetical protein